MNTYEFAGVDGVLITVRAKTEEDARRFAMVKRWGRTPDEVVPHAPDYKGRGLWLNSVTPDIINPQETPQT
jgi:hypothetical protein